MVDETVQAFTALAQMMGCAYPCCIATFKSQPTHYSSPTEWLNLFDCSMGDFIGSVNTNHDTVFQINTLGRTFTFEAQTALERQLWLDVINQQLAGPVFVMFARLWFLTKTPKSDKKLFSAFGGHIGKKCKKTNAPTMKNDAVLAHDFPSNRDECREHFRILNCSEHCFFADVLHALGPRTWTLPAPSCLKDVAQPRGRPGNAKCGPGYTKEVLGGVLGVPWEPPNGRQRDPGSA